VTERVHLNAKGRLWLFLLGTGTFLAFTVAGMLAWLLLHALFDQWWWLVTGASVVFGVGMVLMDWVSEHRG
jgi:hypothetical protein